MLCLRCHEEFGEGRKCEWCGVDRGRRVMRSRRIRKIGGKHGRNSGKVHTAKK